MDARVGRRDRSGDASSGSAVTDKELFQVVLGVVVAHMRGRRQLTQQALADTLSCSQSQLCRIEMGRPLPAFMLSPLASAFDLSVTDFYSLVEDVIGATQKAAAALGVTSFDKLDPRGLIEFVVAARVEKKSVALKTQR